MPGEDKNFGGALVLDLRKGWRHVKTIYIIPVFFFSYFIQLCDSRKIHYLTWKPISHSSLRDSCDIGFHVQFNTEFPRQPVVMIFPIVF